jgi:hypothetical protein
LNVAYAPTLTGLVCKDCSRPSRFAAATVTNKLEVPRARGENR